MKHKIQYASFFNSAFSFMSKKALEKCNKIIYARSGIYSITNKINNYRYIGKSKNVTMRLSQHKSLLRNNHHRYRNGNLSLLQKAWNKYGEDAFEFKIIEFCEVDQLNEREQYWIEYYKCNHAKYRQGYNVTDGGDGAVSNQNVKGRIQVNNGEIQKMIYPEEFPVYEKQGFVRGLLPQNIEKANLNRTILSGEDHWSYKKPLSEEHKRKISESNKGKSAIWNIGKHPSEETRKKRSNSLKGRKPSENTIIKSKEAKQKSVVQYSKNGEKIAEYASIKEAAEKVGLSSGGHISQCCYYKRKTAGGYIWRFKENE